MRLSEDLANFEAVRMERDLACKQHSRVLAQPAARMASVTRSSSANPCFKVRRLITDMIATLEAKAGQDATTYCNSVLSETKTRDREDHIFFEAVNFLLTT